MAAATSGSSRKPPADSSSSQRPRKRIKLLEIDDSSNEGSSSDIAGGVKLGGEGVVTDDPSFKIDEEYARRFEHSQKIAELQRCEYANEIVLSNTKKSVVEEKYGKRSTGNGWKKNSAYAEDENDEGESSSDSEEEDDEGILASGVLDDQINATLQAIREKDPRVYDEKTTFYTGIDEDDEDIELRVKKDIPKPMYLRDYHRENLLRGDLGEDEREEAMVTYTEEQDQLKKSIVKEMHFAAHGVSSISALDEAVDDAEDSDFLRQKQRNSDETSTKRARTTPAPIEVDEADKDPQTFLSNFLSARAWVPSAGTRLQPFESDDDEDDRRAEAFEDAYNMRFENPEGTNEKLLSHARDTAAKYSVRKEHTKSRKRIREAEQAKKEAERLEREQEKARLRKLRLDDAEEKMKKIKDAAGLSDQDFRAYDWSAFLGEDWDDEHWEQEMRKRFGNDYYADRDHGSEVAEDSKRNGKVKKPKWEDDIDITDIITDFEAEQNGQPSLALPDASEGEADDGEDGIASHAANEGHGKRKRHEKEREEQKTEARKERRKLEQLVNEKLDIELALNSATSKHSKASRFRYRDTSPVAYGLTAHDILMASDSQLNQYAGLKKMAPFRDAEKKKKDRKHLGKKARLRQWRMETFGHENGPTKSLQEVLAEQASRKAVEIPSLSSEAEKLDIRDEKKRKRSKKNKGKTTEA